MWGFIWHTFFLDPIYNILVFFIDTVPGGDVGLAIILTVVVVKLLLLPLSIRAVKTQFAMRQIEPQLKELKESYKDKREEQAKAMMELYRKAGVNPFASIVLMFLQIPIFIALYFSVSRGGGVALPDINSDLLYAFIPVPEIASMHFMNVVDITARSLPLALLAGVMQFISGYFALAKTQLPKPDPDAAPSLKDDFARSMQIQMKYGMPLIIAFFSYSISAAIALYFTVSSTMTLVQELIVRRHRVGEQQD